MIQRPELRIVRGALPDAAAPMRHVLSAFLGALEIERIIITDIVTAVGEALANAIEHAYVDTMRRDVMLHARVVDDGMLVVDVIDRGRFIERAQRPGRGFGLRIVRSIATDVSMDTDNGTSISMIFSTQYEPRSLSGP